MYDFKKIEAEVIGFWEKEQIYKKAVEKNSKGKKFYYLDGPPYTTGAIHVGHAWGKSLRDCYLRVLRMKGYKVFDTPGFDMHGLPIEVQVEKEKGINNKQEIVSKIGVENFVKSCEEFAVRQMHPMVKDFKRMGVWLDWDRPYMTIKSQYIEGAWWALKKSQENGYLEKGKKAMTWCPRCATALAKHELEYETREEDSIFVKFRVISEEKNHKPEYLLIWTTTAWTTPFNLGVMVHPEIDYVKADVDGEVWIIAKALAGAVIQGLLGKKFHIIEEFKGEKINGLKYVHPFKEELKNCPETKNAYFVVMSEEYVSTMAGTGLVHCAPGCGPEDFEVGRRNNLKPFNEVDENGFFSNKMGRFAGFRAKEDDRKFIEELKKVDALLAETKVEHEYAHCWRCKTPVIFRATDQWFLLVSKLKTKMLKANEKIKWQPDWAGKKQFKSWLENLQDWCISRQRFWGIPLPIWECTKCKKYEVIGTIHELKERAGSVPENLHIPWIDKVKFICKDCSGEMSRVPDVLDVWLDSGAAPWAVLGFPAETEKFEEYWPIDFILEGSDQIRGWFNSLMCLSMVSHKKPSYKSVYMHGMIHDSQGRKMSKSLKNVISPYEVIGNYGVDAMRYYMVSGSSPGLDLNYNFEDMKTKFRNVGIFVNLANYLLEYSKSSGINPSKIKHPGLLSTEEIYIISKSNSAVKQYEEYFKEKLICKFPIAAEELLLELSRTYVQATREKINSEEREAVLYALYSCYMELLRLFAPVMPFVSEYVYQMFRQEFKLKPESVHLLKWPKHSDLKINPSLESDFLVAQAITQAALAAREKAGLGVRWPISDITIVTQDGEVTSSVSNLKEFILKQVNVKKLKIAKTIEGSKVELTANFSSIGRDFKQDAPMVLKEVNEHILHKVHAEGKAFVGKFELGRQHINVKEKLPDNITSAEFKNGIVYINTASAPELESEGFAREVTRRIQGMRKDNGLKKNDHVEVSIVSDYSISAWAKEISSKVGAKSIFFTEMNYPLKSEETVKTKKFMLGMKILK